MATSPLPWHDLRDGFNADPARRVFVGYRRAKPRPVVELPLSDVISGLSRALDITEGQPEGHAVRSCVLGMKLASMIGLDSAQRSALYYALQLKDLGCSSNAARITQLFDADDHQLKRDFKTTDWPRLVNSMDYVRRNVAPDGSLLKKIGRFLAVGVVGRRAARKLIETRCERGAAIARMFDLPEDTSRAILQLDEHWDGAGHPVGFKGDEICVTARIAGLAQTVEVFASSVGVPGANEMALARRGRWFDPELVDALLSFRHDDAFWSSLYSPGIWETVKAYEPPDRIIMADDDKLDRIALGFAQVVDAKSPWTRQHSEHVTELSVGIARVMGFDADAVRWIRRAALLHDIGKLGVSNMILDKPGPLTQDERLAMMRHPMFTQRILERVPGFQMVAETAASHHERLDGKGYNYGLMGDQLSSPVRALIAADMFEAISAQRPYRETIPLDRAVEVLEAEVGTAVCPQAFRALKYHIESEGYSPSRLGHG